jgi:hypothetical protein
MEREADEEVVERVGGGERVLAVAIGWWRWRKGGGEYSTYKESIAQINTSMQCAI